MSKKNNNKKHINHNPQSESVKAVFGEPKAKGDEFTPKLLSKLRFTPKINKSFQ